MLKINCVPFPNTEFLSSGVGGFLPAMKQIGNVAALPGIVHVSPRSEFESFIFSLRLRVL